MDRIRLHEHHTYQVIFPSLNLLVQKKKIQSEGILLVDKICWGILYSAIIILAIYICRMII